MPCSANTTCNTWTARLLIATLLRSFTRNRWTTCRVSTFKRFAPAIAAHSRIFQSRLMPAPLEYRVMNWPWFWIPRTSRLASTTILFHLQAAYRQFAPPAGALPNTELLARRSLSLPMWSHLEPSIVTEIAAAISLAHEFAPDIKRDISTHDGLAAAVY